MVCAFRVTAAVPIDCELAACTLVCWVCWACRKSCFTHSTVEHFACLDLGRAIVLSRAGLLCRCPGAGKWVEGDADSRASYAQRTQVNMHLGLKLCHRTCRHLQDSGFRFRCSTPQGLAVLRVMHSVLLTRLLRAKWKCKLDFFLHLCLFILMLLYLPASSVKYSIPRSRAGSKAFAVLAALCSLAH